MKCTILPGATNDSCWIRTLALVSSQRRIWSLPQLPEQNRQFLERLKFEETNTHPFVHDKPSCHLVFNFECSRNRTCRWWLGLLSLQTVDLAWLIEEALKCDGDRAKVANVSTSSMSGIGLCWPHLAILKLLIFPTSPLRGTYSDFPYFPTFQQLNVCLFGGSIIFWFWSLNEIMMPSWRFVEHGPCQAFQWIFALRWKNFCPVNPPKIEH